MYCPCRAEDSLWLPCRGEGGKGAKAGGTLGRDGSSPFARNMVVIGSVHNSSFSLRLKVVSHLLFSVVFSHVVNISTIGWKRPWELKRECQRGEGWLVALWL